MPIQDRPSAAQSAGGSPGYRMCRVEPAQDDSEEQRKDKPPKEPPRPEKRREPPDHLLLFGGDRYVATAQDRRIQFYLYDSLPGEAGLARPFAETRLSAPVRRMASRPGESRPVLLAALADRSVIEISLPEPGSGETGEAQPRIRVLVKDLEGEPQYLICTRRNVLVVVDTGESGPLLVELDAAREGVARRGQLPLASLTHVTALDPDRSELLVAMDVRHGAHVVGFPATLDSSSLQVTPIDPDVRATAIAGLGEQWMAVARKGGEVFRARYPAATRAGAEAPEEVCRRLREALRRCGCDCHEHRPGKESPCDCAEDPARPGGGGSGGQPGGGTGGTGQPGGRPGGAGPGGGISDDEPCEERQRANLGWSAARLQPAGHHLVAYSAGEQRMAVLDRRLNVVFERYLGPRGALVATGGGDTGRMLVLQRGKLTLEMWDLDEYARGARAFDRPRLTRRRSGPAYNRPVTYYGRKSRPATPNPDLKIAVFTVTEPGQPFGDPDQARMQALLEPNVYRVVRDYYRENSFQTVETVFSVFGVHIGGVRRPLVLPRAFASYFYDAFSPGGIEAVMPGNWASPLRLDGTESLTLRSDPAVGTGRDYAIPFAALWTTRTHNAYPVVVNFAGTETLRIDVEDQLGMLRTLNLTFPALALSHAQGDDETAFLQALGQHVTNAIRAAETAAGAPTLIQNVVFRRIRLNDNDAEFGRLQGQFRVAAAGGATQKGRITLTPPAAPPAPLVALGLNGAGSRSGVLGSAPQIVGYFAECIHAARFDAGEGLGLNDPQLNDAVTTVEDPVAQQVRVRVQLTPEKGGVGAEITLVSSSGHVQSGWSAAAPVPGSDSNSNNSDTLRSHQELANDVFTAAMDHIRATGAWNAEAVRAQFADFDVMMIGFVGACPMTVPAADRWNSADAVDFARLRMFRRSHQATDLHNPNPADPPVTMGTNVIIGQRFNQFDPGVMSHELGHALGLPDLYSASGFRDDVVYIDSWCQMAGRNERFNHFCAWSKWSVGWIVDNPGDPALNRVVNVPMPDPSSTTETEAWLYPVEYFDNNIRADVEAAVGTGLPVGQMMKLHLGSDGGIVDLIELRARGMAFSQNLPPTPAVIATNVLQPGTDQRWAVNGLYRRSVHLLNQGSELTSVGDTFDFAASPEFPLKGCRMELMELRTIRGGSLPIARVKVVRQPAEFIDLFFQDNVPSWRSPDIWVDWPRDNANPAEPRVYPEGTPTDQGEVVRFPGTGVEPHFLVVRPHNAGNVRAEDVKVRWFICDPPGAGDRGRWLQRDTITLAQVDGSTWQIAPFTWNVDHSTSAHQCLRAEIIDWTIPNGVDPATGDTVALGSDDVRLQNNNAQKNVFDFEAAT